MEKQKFDIDVIIPVRNGGAFISQTLESVLKQTLPPCSVIVIDDHSEDETGKIASMFAERFARRGVKFSYYFLPERHGVSGARNYGLSRAASPYILFLDSDDIIVPEHLYEFAVAYDKATEKNILYYAHYQLIDRRGEVVAGNNRHILVYPQGNIFKPLSINNLFLRNLAQVIFPRDIFSDGLVFDTHLVIAEDWDLFLKIAKTRRFQLINKPLLRKRDHKLSVMRRQEYSFQHLFEFYELWIDRGVSSEAIEAWTQQTVLKIILAFPSWSLYSITKNRFVGSKYRKIFFPHFNGILPLNTLYILARYVLGSLKTKTFWVNVRRYFLERRRYNLRARR